MLTSDGPVAAYASMLRGTPGHIKFLGPSFFTKYLYYADGTTPAVTPAPLILDQFVARGLNTTDPAVWDLPDNNWSAATYSRYLDWAAERARAAGPGHPAAGVELGLFQVGRCARK